MSKSDSCTVIMVEGGGGRPGEQLERSGKGPKQGGFISSRGTSYLKMRK